MLCPEVWNFKAPESNFSSVKLQQNENNHLNTVHNFIYNHLVSVILPDTFKVPESLTQALINDCDYYKVAEVPLSELVSKDFINNFVNSGNLYVVTVDSRLDCDNCVAVTPSGQLILNLNKCTYQSLGLEGRVSHFHAKTAERYIVTIDLKAKYFIPGKANYERAKKCLEKIKLNLILSWEPPGEEVCPSSVAKYLHDLGYDTKLCQPKHKSHTLYTVKLPAIKDDNHFEITEWLGMVALDADLDNGGPECHLSNYETPEPNREVGQVRVLQWRGFFTANQIVKLLKELGNIPNPDWLAMYVQGFSDSPVAWKGEEHHYYTNGDNGYVYILNRDGSSVMCTQKCSRKQYNNKRKA